MLWKRLSVGADARLAVRLRLSHRREKMAMGLPVSDGVGKTWSRGVGDKTGGFTPCQ